MNFKEGDLIRMTSSCSRSEKGNTYTLRILNGVLSAGDCSCRSKWEIVQEVDPNKPVGKFNLSMNF